MKNEEKEKISEMLRVWSSSHDDLVLNHSFRDRINGYLDLVMMLKADRTMVSETSIPYLAFYIVSGIEKPLYNQLDSMVLHIKRQVDRSNRKGLYMNVNVVGNNNIKRIREDKGITQKALAESLGIDYKVLSAYETGYRKLELASFNRVCKIAKVLDCKVSDLFDDEEIKRSLDRN